MVTEILESPLGRIRTREREIAEEVEAARERAADRIERAESEAETKLAWAERDGAAEAESTLEEAISEAEKEAEEIRRDAEERAAKLQQRAEAAIPEAAQLIISRVLPSLERDVEAMIEREWSADPGLEESVGKPQR